MIIVRYSVDDIDEYIMNFATKRPAVFRDIESAKKGLKKLGWKEADFERFEFVESNAFCPRCGYPLVESDLPEYSFLCVDCDENFYSFEVRGCRE